MLLKEWTIVCRSVWVGLEKLAIIFNDSFGAEIVTDGTCRWDSVDYQLFNDC